MEQSKPIIDTCTFCGGNYSLKDIRRHDSVFKTYRDFHITATGRTGSINTQASAYNKDRKNPVRCWRLSYTK